MIVLTKIRIAARARIAMTLVALALLVPVLGIAWQDQVKVARFHNRALSAWPASSAFASPPDYFRQARAWLADRVWPLEAVMLQKRILYFALATPPAHKLTIAADGQVFLSSWNEVEPNVLFESLCVRAHGDETRRGLARALPDFAEYARQRSVAFDMLVVPTTATLYAQRLPRSVQRRLRDACGAVAAGQSALRDVDVPPGLHYLYAYDALRPYLDDPGFYPRNGWHASGKSLAVLRDAWLASIGFTPAIDERIEPVVQMAEMLLMSGVVDPQPAYVVRNPHVRADAARNAAFRAAIGDLFTNPAFPTNVFTNADAPVGESLLIVSDSFGQLASEVFAGAFADVVQVNTNDLPFGDVATLIDRAQALQRADRILLLFQEGGVDRAINYARVLRLAAEKPPPAG